MLLLDEVELSGDVTGGQRVVSGDHYNLITETVNDLHRC